MDKVARLWGTFVAGTPSVSLVYSPEQLLSASNNKNGLTYKFSQHRKGDIVPTLDIS